MSDALTSFLDEPNSSFEEAMNKRQEAATMENELKLDQKEKHITDRDVLSVIQSVTSGQIEEEELIKFLSDLIPPRPISVSISEGSKDDILQDLETVGVQHYRASSLQWHYGEAQIASQSQRELLHPLAG